MSDTLIEKAARAIVDELARQDSADFKLPVGSLKLDYIDQGEVDFGLVARAVLQAIREPTGAVEMEACNLDVDSEGPGAVYCWQAMIDAALKEG